MSEATGTGLSEKPLEEAAGTVDLHPDLEPWLDFDGHMPILKHPLVVWPYDAGRHGLLNGPYAQKRQYVARAEREHAWETYVWLHERPYRLEAFLDVFRHLADAEYWELLSALWIDSENI